MTQLGYVLPRLDKYQHYIDFSALFNGRNDTSQSANCVLVPTSSDVYRGDERVVLEIGFGLGDNLLSNAMMFPDICFLGAEVVSFFVTHQSIYKQVYLLYIFYQLVLKY